MQHIPHKPSYMSDDDYALILERDKRRCVYYGQCPQSDGAFYCSDKLQFDHHHPRELGGDDSFANVRLLCESENCGRPLEPAPQWAADDNYWDDGVEPGRLREVQRMAGWDALDEVERMLPTSVSRREARRKLLGTTTLAVGATGIGKTVLMQSILFRFNKLVGPGSPRVRHVLFLVTDNTLADAAVKELKGDTVKHGFANRPPDVRRAESFTDLERGPQGSDLVVCTVQTLWFVRQGEGAVRRTDLEVKRALSRFDTLIFDECDWGSEQLRHVARLAGHMLQFAMTATPRVGALASGADDQAFLKRFILITPQAIASYNDAVRLDGALKLFLEPQPRGTHPGFEEVYKGRRRSVDGTMKPDHALWRGTILEAITDADHLETRMKEEAPDEWYSPHMMVRFDSIQDVKLMYNDLKAHLAERSNLQNEGWDVCMVFQNYGRYVKEPLEKDLTAKKGEKFIHPFMRALNTNGQADKACKRILLMCNIGVRGLNNWPVSYIVDCTEGRSIPELIHFAYGRAIRWRGRKHWLLEGSPLSSFATARIIVPNNSHAVDKLEDLRAARTFIEQMKEQVGGAGFLTWRDLIEGVRLDDPSVVIDASNRPLTTPEIWRIQSDLAEAAQISEGLAPALIDPMMQRRFGDAPPAIQAKIRKYAEQFVIDSNFRRGELFAEPDDKTKAGAVAVMLKLRPQTTYDIEMLQHCAETYPAFSRDIKQLYISALSDPENTALHQLAVDAVSRVLREEQTRNYSSASDLYSLYKDKSVFADLAHEMYKNFEQAELPPPEKKDLYRCLIGAAKRLFDVENADEHGPLDQPAYHIAILGRYRATICKAARGSLIRHGHVGEALQCLANQT